MPPWLRTAMEFEASVWTSIAAWILRKPRVPPGATAHPYLGAVSTVLWVFIVLSAVEIPIFDLLLQPWPWVRIPVLLLGIWGLTFMIGFLLSMLVNPHAVGDEGIRVRHGARIDIAIPWENVRAVTLDQRGYEKSTAVQVDGTVLSICLISETNVRIELDGPLTVDLPAGPTVVTEIRCRVDDAGAFVRDARAALAAASSR